MGGGKVFVIAFGSAIVGGLVVAALMSERERRSAKSLGSGLVQSPKGPSPMISGFNRPLEKDHQTI